MITFCAFTQPCSLDCASGQIPEGASSQVCQRLCDTRQHKRKQQNFKCNDAFPQAIAAGLCKTASGCNRTDHKDTVCASTDRRSRLNCGRSSHSKTVLNPSNFSNGFNMLKQLHVLHLISRFRHSRDWSEMKFAQNITVSPGDSRRFPLLMDMNVLTQ